MYTFISGTAVDQQHLVEKKNISAKPLRWQPYFPQLHHICYNLWNPIFISFSQDNIGRPTYEYFLFFIHQLFLTRKDAAQ